MWKKAKWWKVKLWYKHNFQICDFVKKGWLSGLTRQGSLIAAFKLTKIITITTWTIFIDSCTFLLCFNLSINLLSTFRHAQIQAPHSKVLDTGHQTRAVEWREGFLAELDVLIHLLLGLPAEYKGVLVHTLVSRTCGILSCYLFLFNVPLVVFSTLNMKQKSTSYLWWRSKQRTIF